MEIFHIKAVPPSDDKVAVGSDLATFSYLLSLIRVNHSIVFVDAEDWPLLLNVLSIPNCYGVGLLGKPGADNLRTIRYWCEKTNTNYFSTDQVFERGVTRVFFTRQDIELSADVVLCRIKPGDDFSHVLDDFPVTFRNVSSRSAGNNQDNKLYAVCKVNEVLFYATGNCITLLTKCYVGYLYIAYMYSLEKYKNYAIFLLRLTRFGSVRLHSVNSLVMDIGPHNGYETMPRNSVQYSIELYNSIGLWEPDDVSIRNWAKYSDHLTVTGYAPMTMESVPMMDIIIAAFRGPGCRHIDSVLEQVAATEYESYRKFMIPYGLLLEFIPTSQGIDRLVHTGTAHIGEWVAIAIHYLVSGSAWDLACFLSSLRSKAKRELVDSVHKFRPQLEFPVGPFLAASGRIKNHRVKVDPETKLGKQAAKYNVADNNNNVVAKQTNKAVKLEAALTVKSRAKGEQKKSKQ